MLLYFTCLYKTHYLSRHIAFFAIIIYVAYCSCFTKCKSIKIGTKHLQVSLNEFKPPCLFRCYRTSCKAYVKKCLNVNMYWQCTLYYRTRLRSRRVTYTKKKIKNQYVIVAFRAEPWICYVCTLLVRIVYILHFNNI